MKKLLLFLSLLSMAISSEITTVTSVIEQSEKTVIMTESKTAEVGQNALIVRNLSTGDKLIGYSCDIVQVVGKKAVLNCERFTGLDKDSMPKIGFKAKEGDDVVINPLSKRAVIISTSQAGYLKTKQLFRGYQFVHPDLLAITLFTEDNPFPVKEDFRNFCDKYYVSSIVFDLSDKRRIVNCQTFKEIRAFSKSKNTDEKVMKPFFHRLAKIETSFWDFSTGNEIDNFDEYYEGIIDAN